MEKINRRKFIGATSAGGAALIMNNYQNTPAQTASDSFEFDELTVSELQSAMQSGKFSAREITQKYLERIEKIDKKLNSIIEVNPDALKIAEESDKNRKNGKVYGALHGIPVVLKDNIDTADRMKTTAGSLALIDAPPPKRDASVAEQLRKAGAIIIAKTNLSEWANFRSTNSSSGWSGRGGQTHNPYILDRNPCGSSSGTGAAVAANLAAVGIGTETDGSIVCPASICGLVGLKPTLGLISRSGIIPIAHSQDTAGPMTRTVTDAAIVLNALTGVDERDSATAQNKQKAASDYTKFLNKDGLKGKRIGIARQYFGRNSRVDSLMETQIQVLRDGGATVIDVNFPGFSDFSDAEYQVLLYEFKSDLNKYLAERNAPYQTLKSLIEFNEKNKDREMPFFGQEIFLQADEKGDLASREYRLALLQSKVATQDRGIDYVIKNEKLDAVFAPSNSPTWMIDLVNGDCGGSYIGSSSIPAVSGYPNITVPAGFINELPIGVSFFSGAYTEPVLLGIAYSFEQMTKARRKPKFLPTYGQ